MPDNTINPATFADQKVLDEQTVELATKRESTKVLTERLKGIDAKLEKVTKDIGEGNGIDFESAEVKEVLGDVSAKEQMAKLMEINAHQMALRAELSKRAAMLTKKAQIERGEQTAESFENEFAEFANAQKSELIGDQIYATLEENGAVGKLTKGQFHATEANIGAIPNLQMATVQTSSTYPETTIAPVPGIRPSVQRPVQVTDLFPMIPVSGTAYVYMEETTFTNAATEKAPGNAGTQASGSRSNASGVVQSTGFLAESALALTRRSIPMLPVGTILPVDEDLLEDQTAFASYINQRLGFMVNQQVDGKLVVGADGANSVIGIDHGANKTTVAANVANKWNGILDAITALETANFAPDGVIVHPTVWSRINQSSGTDNRLIAGDPRFSLVPSAWGLPVAKCSAGAATDVYVGAFQSQSNLAVRQALRVETGLNDTDFALLLISVRAYVRMNLALYNANAFSRITFTA